MSMAASERGAHTPEAVFSQYRRGVEYNREIGLYDTVRQNENFFIGKQWEGVNAPDLDKPVFNVLKRVVNYFIAMLVSDDISARVEPFDGDPDGFMADSELRLINAELRRCMEDSGAKLLGRDCLRDAAVDGDACLHAFYEGGKGQARGGIRLERIENTCVIFSDPCVHDIQKQLYILLPMRLRLDEATSEAKRYAGKAEDIEPDSEDENGAADSSDDGVTVILKYWKDEGTGKVFASKTTKAAVVRPAWDTGLERYPVAYFSWDKVRNSYHGQAAVTGLIPNQIAINKLYAMYIKSVKDMAFPKVLFDVTRLKRWTNKVGEAIGVYGSPNEAVARAMPGADVSVQVGQLINSLIATTRDLMGASDAALGNVRPDNTSAIIAVQKAASAPLELQRISYYAFVEDYIRIFLDMMRAYYGKRHVALPGGERAAVDFSKLGGLPMRLNVQVGQSAYWSELMQIQTLDNLFARGIIKDARTYVESIPDGYIRDRARILEQIDGIARQT